MTQLNDEDTVNDPASDSTPWHFWVIAGVALIWNLMGAINFVVQLDPEMIASYRESEQMIIANRPLWATAGFALAVFGGLLGSILLLLRNRLAVAVFSASLIGVVVTMVHTLTLGIEFGAGEIVGVILMPVAVAVFLVWFSLRLQQRLE